MEVIFHTPKNFRKNYSWTRLDLQMLESKFGSFLAISLLIIYHIFGGFKGCAKLSQAGDGTGADLGNKVLRVLWDTLYKKQYFVEK
jgi:hypothetical protein